jgi:pimeloyl-ACP methyl ester carboxylesterase
MQAIRKAYVDCDGGPLHFRYVKGPGTPLLLFHRTPVSSACFEPLMRELAGTRGLYAFDTPGFGASFDPPGAPDAATCRDWFITAIDALAIGDFHLFGHHTGTHIATEIAAALPARARSLIVNGVLYVTDAERAAFRAAVADPAPVDEAGTYLGATWSIVKSLFPKFDAALAHTEFVGALRALEGCKQAFDMIFAQDYRAVLARVRCPILALAAEDDPLRPFLDRIPAALPHATARVLGRAGIAAPELDTARLAAAIREFLERIDA